MLTKAEVLGHYPLHLNYRSWCKHCVAGKARLAQHMVADPGRERLGVTWNADCALMGAEEAEESMQPTLVGMTMISKVSGHVVCVTEGHQ